MVADVLERPTVEAAEPEGAAHVLYGPLSDETTPDPDTGPRLTTGISTSRPQP